MGLTRKRILITAGPTWVPIDKVRVVSNIASGKTGILIAEEADSLGFEATLILGPVGDVYLGKTINVKRFCYFEELQDLIRKELQNKKFDIVIHSAAVSDYKLKKSFSGKIKSNQKILSLELKKTIKIVDKIKKYAPDAFLTIFKLELGISKNEMLKSARKTMSASDADLAVVNTFSNKNPYEAFVIDQNKEFCSVNSKESLVKKLLHLISTKIS